MLMKNEKQMQEAKNEPPISASELIAEIKPLLDDYFIGDISFDGEEITYRLLNGQTFLLKAERVDNL